MKKTWATLTALTGVSLPAVAHTGAAGHQGAEGVLPHIHMAGTDFVWLVLALGAGGLVWKLIKKRGETHDPR